MTPVKKTSNLNWREHKITEGKSEHSGGGGQFKSANTEERTALMELCNILRNKLKNLCRTVVTEGKKKQGNKQVSYQICLVSLSLSFEMAF